MARLPPVEKLSLALRKNVRDEWDSKKADFEKQLSDVLGTAWTIDINPHAIWPYHNDGYAKISLGSCIKSYVDGAIYQIKYLVSKYDSLAEEINTLANAHILTLEVDDSEPKRFSYSGTDVQDGKLRLLFRPDALGSNVDDAAQENRLFPALNAAPGEKPLSFTVRHGIRADYDPKAEALRAKIGTLLERPEIKFVPGFDDIYSKLQAAAAVKGSDVRDDWQTNLGSFTLKYFEGLEWQLKNLKVDSDELVREGFNEAVGKGELAFRIVDKLQYGSYNEVVIEDEVLYIQTTADKWGINIDYAAENLLDQL